MSQKTLLFITSVIAVGIFFSLPMKSFANLLSYDCTLHFCICTYSLSDGIFTHSGGTAAEATGIYDHTPIVGGPIYACDDNATPQYFGNFIADTWTSDYWPNYTKSVCDQTLDWRGQIPCIKVSDLYCKCDAPNSKSDTKFGCWSVPNATTQPDFTRTCGTNQYCTSSSNATKTGWPCSTSPSGGTQNLGPIQISQSCNFTNPYTKGSIAYNLSIMARWNNVTGGSPYTILLNDDNLVYYNGSRTNSENIFADKTQQGKNVIIKVTANTLNPVSSSTTFTLKNCWTSNPGVTPGGPGNTGGSGTTGGTGTGTSCTATIDKNSVKITPSNNNTLVTATVTAGNAQRVDVSITAVDTSTKASATYSKNGIPCKGTTCILPVTLNQAFPKIISGHTYTITVAFNSWNSCGGIINSHTATGSITLTYGNTTGDTTSCTDPLTHATVVAGNECSNKAICENGSCTAGCLAPGRICSISGDMCGPNGGNCVACKTGIATSFTLSLKLQGIGTGNFENNTPAHPLRNAAYVRISNETGLVVYNSSLATFTYNTSNGLFVGPKVNLGTALSCGHRYTISAKLPGYVKVSQALAYAGSNVLTLTPIPGDLVANSNNNKQTTDGKIIGDDVIDTLDYNVIRQCHNVDPSTTLSFANNTSTIQIKCSNLINLFDYQDGGTQGDEWAFNYNLWTRGFLTTTGITTQKCASSASCSFGQVCSAGICVANN